MSFSFFWTTKINLNVILTYTNFKFKILLQEYNSPILKLYFLNISFYLLFLVILFDNALPLNNQHDSTSFKWIMQRINLLLLLILRYVVAIVLEKPTLKFLIIRRILAQFKVFLFYNQFFYRLLWLFHFICLKLQHNKKKYYYKM